MTDNQTDAQLAANIQTLKAHTRARAEAIKHALRQWLENTVHPADTVSASIALLDTGFDRYLDIHDEADAREFIKAFNRAVQRRRGALQ